MASNRLSASDFPFIEGKGKPSKGWMTVNGCDDGDVCVCSQHRHQWRRKKETHLKDGRYKGEKENIASHTDMMSPLLQAEDKVRFQFPH
jgi:hypothetical protein